jgi:N-acyl-D-amino-acid deacylase
VHADLMFRGARVADGDRPPRLADVAVSGGRIAAVAERLPLDSCGELVQADGLLLCPGFIDMHAHSALRAFTDPLLTPKLVQGFTTEVICPDGLGPAPVRPWGRKERQRYLAALEGSGPERWAWESVADYLDAVEAARPAANIVMSVPHSAVRDAVLGTVDRRAEPAELARMQHEVKAGLAAGARVLSFGLIYAPGLYADTTELQALAEAAADYGAPLMPHVRNEGAGVLDAIDEFVQVAEHASTPLHISHLKLVGSPQLLQNLLHLVEDAAQRIDLTFDQYPYGAGNTLLTALLPPWALAGGPVAIVRRLRERDDRRRMVRDMERGLPGWENLYKCCGPAGITITNAGGTRSSDVGKSLEQIVDERRLHPAVAVLDLLADTDLDVAMIDHYASEDVVRAIFALPGAMVGSDGIFGPHPHPRLFGTAARVLGRLALREGLITVEEAVARLASRPADRLGLSDRGRIKRGQRADLVLLDPDRYVDTATYSDPCRIPPGVERVLVGGCTVYRDNKLTGRRPGTVTRTPRG